MEQVKAIGAEGRYKEMEKLELLMKWTHNKKLGIENIKEFGSDVDSVIKGERANLEMVIGLAEWDVKVLQEKNSEYVDFIQWIDDQCPAGYKTNDMSHDFADLLRERLTKIMKPR